jgi:molecular chaperone GrpE
MSEETAAPMAAPQDGTPEMPPEAEPGTMLGDVVTGLQNEIDRLNGELEGLKRAAAEEINRAKRAEREAEDKVKFSLTSFARDLLAVADNLRRALDSRPGETLVSEGIKGFVEGVEMTERTLLATLEKFGVKPVDCLGKRFDPNFHQAMFEVEDLAQPSGMVVQVMQAGYTINERLLRPALVGVSKGGPRPGLPEGGIDTTA